MTFKTITLILCSSLLFACKKRVEKERPEFIGLWLTDRQPSDSYWFEIDIDENSNGLYTEHTAVLGGEDVHISGTVRANNKHLKIGRLNSFKILEYPHKIDTANSNVLVPYPDYGSLTYKKANWIMKLDGPMFYIGTGTYYKAEY